MTPYEKLLVVVVLIARSLKPKIKTGGFKATALESGNLTTNSKVPVPLEIFVPANSGKISSFLVQWTYNNQAILLELKNRLSDRKDIRCLNLYLRELCSKIEASILERDFCLGGRGRSK